MEVSKACRKWCHTPIFDWLDLHQEPRQHCSHAHRHPLVTIDLLFFFVVTITLVIGIAVAHNTLCVGCMIFGLARLKEWERGYVQCAD